MAAPTAFLLLLITVNVFHNAQTHFNDTIRLFNNILKSYGTEIRPVVNTSKPTIVNVSFNVRKLLNFIETDQKFDLNAWLNFTWIDEIRTWNTEDYDGIRFVHPQPKDIWRPGILISNSFLYKDIFERQNTPISLRSNGLVHWYPGDVFSAYCTLNMTYFPFDEQTCFIRIQATEYIEEIKLVSSVSSIINDSYISNGEWRLKTSRVVADEQIYHGESFSRMTFYMDFKRKPEFFVYNVLIPVILVSFLSSLTFVLPEDSGDRASFSITVLLSLSLFMGMVSEQLPKNSDTFPIMVTYLFVLLLHSGSCVFVTVLHLRWTQFNIGRKIKRDQAKKVRQLNISCQLETNSSPQFQFKTNYHHETRSHPVQSTIQSDNGNVEIYLCNISKGDNTVDPGEHRCDKYANILNRCTDPLSGTVESRSSTTLCAANSNGVSSINTGVFKRVIEKIRDQYLRKSASTLHHYLTDLNMQIFIFFNMSWIVISAIFLNKLSGQINS